MNPNVPQYQLASLLLVMSGIVAVSAGLWLAMQHEWAGAAGCAVAVAAAITGLVVVGDRVDASIVANTVTASMDEDEIARAMEQLRRKGVVEHDG